MTDRIWVFKEGVGEPGPDHDWKEVHRQEGPAEFWLEPPHLVRWKGKIWFKSEVGPKYYPEIWFLQMPDRLVYDLT